MGSMGNKVSPFFTAKLNEPPTNQSGARFFDFKQCGGGERIYREYVIKVNPPRRTT